MSLNRPPTSHHIADVGSHTHSPADILLKPRKVPAFTADRLSHDLTRDRVLRYTVGSLLALLFVIDSIDDSNMSSQMSLIATNVGVIGTALLLGLWIMFTFVVANVTRTMPRITQALDSDPILAETLIATGLLRWPITDSARLLLYHRLAMLRYRERRYAEASEIAANLLAYDDNSSIRPLRPHLLLIVIECRIRARDLVGAYYALVDIRRLKLSLSESLQSMLLQTHYEILAGHSLQALTGWRDKIEMAELMPASQCGALHELVAIAAHRERLPDLATWLMERSRLFNGQSEEAVGQ